MMEPAARLLAVAGPRTPREGAEARLLLDALSRPAAFAE